MQLQMLDIDRLMVQRWHEIAGLHMCSIVPGLKCGAISSPNTLRLRITAHLKSCLPRIKRLTFLVDKVRIVNLG